MNYDWDFGVLDRYWIAIAKGALVTLELTGLVIVAGTAIGIPLGLVLRTKVLPVRWLTTLVNDVVRSLPILILILWFYYLLPIMTGYRGMPSFLVAAIALSLNLSAFIADVVRGAVDNVPKSHIEAAAAVGLRRSQILRRVVIPEVIQSSLPTLALLYISILKLSSLASVIAVVELTHTASLVITDTFRSLEVYSVVAGIYVALVLPFSWLARKVEQRGVVERVEA